MSWDMVQLDSRAPTLSDFYEAVANLSTLVRYVFIMCPLRVPAVASLSIRCAGRTGLVFCFNTS